MLTYFQRTAVAMILGLTASLMAGLSSQAIGDEPDGLAIAAALERALMEAIDQAETSVVSIARIKRPPQKDPIGNFGDRLNAPWPPQNAGDAEDPELPDFVPNDFGAGIIIGSEGPKDRISGKAFILTNHHVVKGGTIDGQAKPSDYSLHVRLANRRGYDARIFAADPRSDLAVLIIDEPDVKPIKFGNGSKLKKGQLVVALGNPYAIARDGSASASWGMISNISRRPELSRGTGQDALKDETIHHLGNLLHVNTRLNLGTSGGALVNLRGELIGITTSLAALAGYEKSVGYAVPLDEATTRIINTLREGKEVEYGFLGVSWGPTFDFNSQAPKHRRWEGAEVEDVVANSPAARGGLMPHDWILAVNDKPIFSRVDLTREIGKLPPEEKTRLKVLRERTEEPQTVVVELGKWPVRDDEGIIASKKRFEPWRGLVVDYPTGRYKYIHQYIEKSRQLSFSAVLVTESAHHSSAARADLEPGEFITHVNGKPVGTPRQFYEAVRGLNGDVTLQLLGGSKVVVPAP